MHVVEFLPLLCAFGCGVFAYSGYSQWIKEKQNCELNRTIQTICSVLNVGVSTIAGLQQTDDLARIRQILRELQSRMEM